MQFDTPRRHRPQINLSALIDVAFILVIFVVLAANFNRLDALHVDLPEAKASGAADTRSLVITLPARGDLRVGDEVVSIAGVGEVLKKHVGSFDSVLLMADQNASVQHAVEILAHAQSLGFRSVGIASQGAPAP